MEREGRLELAEIPRPGRRETAVGLRGNGADPPQAIRRTTGSPFANAIAPRAHGFGAYRSSADASSWPRPTGVIAQASICTDAIPNPIPPPSAARHSSAGARALVG